MRKGPVPERKNGQNWIRRSLESLEDRGISRSMRQCSIGIAELLLI